MWENKITRRATLPGVAFAAASLVQSSVYAQPEKNNDDDSFPVWSPDLKALKQSMRPFAKKWWTVKSVGSTYHFCREEYFYTNESRFDFHGWRQANGDDDERLFHIWSFRSYGAGNIEMKIDETEGTVTVMGLERKLKGKQLSFLDLRAARP